LLLGLLDLYYPKRVVTLSTADPGYIITSIKWMVRPKVRLMRSGRVYMYM